MECALLWFEFCGIYLSYPNHAVHAQNFELRGFKLWKLSSTIIIRSIIIFGQSNGVTPSTDHLLKLKNLPTLMSLENLRLFLWNINRVIIKNVKDAFFPYNENLCCLLKTLYVIFIALYVCPMEACFCLILTFYLFLSQFLGKKSELWDVQTQNCEKKKSELWD